MPVAVFAFGEAADAQVIAAGTGVLGLGGPGRAGLDGAAADLVAHGAQAVGNVSSQYVKLLGGDLGVRGPRLDRAVDRLPFRGLFPGLHDGLIIEDDAAAALPLFPLLFRILRFRIRVKVQQVVAGGHIEDAGGLGRPAVEGLGPVAEGEEIEQHLHIAAVDQVREAELLMACLIVRHTQPEAAVLLPAVHAVGDAGQGDGVPGLAETETEFGNVQLEGQGYKVRAAHLFRGVEDDAAGIAAEAEEEMAETRAFILQPAELFLHIGIDGGLGNRLELVIRHRAEAAAVGDLAGGTLKDGVQEGADLRRAEAGRFIGLGLEAELAEIAELAVGKTLEPGGADIQAWAVEGSD